MTRRDSIIGAALGAGCVFGAVAHDLAGAPWGLVAALGGVLCGALLAWRGT